MTVSTISDEKLWDSFNAKTDIILTPQQRLAEHLSAKYNASIYAEANFIQWYWDKLSELGIDLPFVLSYSQEWALWEKIIRAHFSANETLIDPLELAKISQEAASTLSLWLAESSFNQASLSYEQEQFKTWLEVFRKECKHYHYCTNAERYVILAQKIKTTEHSCPNKLFFYEFDDFHPSLKYLIEAFRSKGTEVIQIEATVSLQETAACKIAFPDRASEYYAAAEWCYQQLKAQPKKKLACLIPSLSEHRQTVLDIFQRVFNNHYRINISMGSRLSTFPDIQAALFFLSQNSEQWSYENFLILAYNRFIEGFKNEKLARIALCEQLKKHQNYYFKLSEIIILANTPEKPYFAPELAKNLSNYLATLNDQPQLAEPETWAEIFKEQLRSYGWLFNPLFLNCLEEMKKTNLLSTLWTRMQALNHLRAILDNLIYQLPKEDADLHILGLLEASGIPFDALWICGLNEGVFPPNPEPHPFIPYALQRKLAMPHASIQREYDFCQKVFHRLLQHSSETIVSYALYEGEQHLLESTLLKPIPLAKKNYSSSPWKLLLNNNFINLEYYQDTQGPAVYDCETIQGGSRILELQALCPFRAFAEVRLQIRPQETLSEALSQQERGSLLHQCLENVWSKLQSHATLQSLSDNALFGLIEDAIELALTDMKKEYFSSHYLAIEKKRLKLVLTKWLNYEKQRAEFTVVAIEQKQMLSIKSVPIYLKIDRIDELADGSRIIIDYKTGKSTPSFDWSSARPKGIQLPLYALSENLNVHGLAMAKVNAKETKFLGLSKHEGALPEVKSIHSHKHYKDFESWESLLSFWKSNLEKLMQDFIEGKAELDPLEPETCRHCHLASLCRYKF